MVVNICMISSRAWCAYSLEILRDAAKSGGGSPTPKAAQDDHYDDIPVELSIIKYRDIASMPGAHVVLLNSKLQVRHTYVADGIIITCVDLVGRETPFAFEFNTWPLAPGAGKKAGRC